MKHGWVLIMAACLGAYANSFDNGFHYDDEHSILRNIHVRDLGKVPSFFADPKTFSVDPDKGMYRPLLLVTYALNYAQGRYEAFGYHVVNLLLHGLNAGLVWWLAGVMLGRREVALLAGLLFAMHPLGSEPVNYVSSRSESLAALFYLLGLGLFASAAQPGRERRAVFSWAALALGLLSKSTVITLPAVLLAWDYLLISRRDFGRFKQELVRRHGPYWIIAAGYLLLIAANGFLTGSLAKPVRDGWTQLLTQIKAFAYYLQLLVLPLRLNVEHQFFAQKSLQGAAMFGALLLLLSFVSLLLYLYRRRCDLPLFLFLWGILALLPAMVMPLNVLVNERRLYLSCAAFCVGLAWVLRSGWMQQKRVGGQDLGRLLAAVAVLGYGVLTFDRNPVWMDEFSLWQDAVEKAPRMPRVHLYLGNAHKDAALRSRDGQQALKHWQAAANAYQRTMELDPAHDLALRASNNLGGVHFMLMGLEPGKKIQHLEKAESAYRRAVEVNPQYADALVNLGTAYHERFRIERGRRKVLRRDLLEQAITYYQKALAILPNHDYAHANMGLAYFHLGELAQARQHYERAYYLNPRNERLLSNMGDLWVTLGQGVEGEQARNFLLKARQFYLQARQLNPAYSSSQRGLEYVDKILSAEQE